MHVILFVCFYIHIQPTKTATLVPPLVHCCDTAPLFRHCYSPVERLDACVQEYVLFLLLSFFRLKVSYALMYKAFTEHKYYLIVVVSAFKLVVLKM